MAKWTKRNNPHTWRKTGGAIVVSRSAPMQRRSSSKIVLVPTGGGGGRGRRRSSGTITKHIGKEVRKGAALGGAVIGYIEKNHASMWAQIPSVAGSPIITLAIATHLYAEDNPGGYADHIATAATAIAAYNIGQRGLSLSAPDPVSTVSGPGDRAEW